jgi:hypothetical protein
LASKDLHDRGLWVVPCEGKHAVVKGWDTKRLSREDLVKILNGTHLNIAIVLNQSDVIDVECDSEEAEAALLAMFDEDFPRLRLGKVNAATIAYSAAPPDCLKNQARS